MTSDAPIALPRAVFLDFVGSLIGVAGLAKELRDLVLGEGSLSLRVVVRNIVDFVGTSHGRASWECAESCRQQQARARTAGKRGL